MDRIEQKICNTQKNIYIYAAKSGYSPESFSEAYLKSEFCAEAFDTEYSRYQFETPIECMDFILPEIEKQLVKTDNIDIDLAGYVGMMYRYLYFITPYTSRELADKAPFNAVAKTAGAAMIEGEHLAVEDICKELKLEYYPDKIQSKDNALLIYQKGIFLTVQEFYERQTYTCVHSAYRSIQCFVQE